MSAARAHGNPLLVVHALYAHGLAYTTSDPARALDSYEQGLDYTREHRIRFIETVFARQAAHLTTVQGDLDRALTLHDSVIESFHQSGTITDLGLTLFNLAATFRRLERLEIAATVYGSATRLSTTSRSHLPGELRSRARRPPTSTAAPPPAPPWSPPQRSATPASRSSSPSTNEQPNHHPPATLGNRPGSRPASSRRQPGARRPAAASGAERRCRRFSC